MAAKKNESNFDKLKAAHVTMGKLTPAERAAVENLTPAEVDAILSAKVKLGDEFLKKHVPHGMMF